MPRSADGIRPAPAGALVARAARRAILLLGLLATATATAQDAASDATKNARRSFRVSYLSASTVYLDGGRQDGLAAGARLEVRRSGDSVAMLEVAYVADHSASCRVVSQHEPPQQGDEAILLSTPAPASEPAPSAAPTTTTPQVSSLLSPYAPQRAAAAPWARSSGYVSLATQSYSDQQFGGGWNDRAGRLTLRLRDIDQMPLEFQLRLSARESGYTSGSGTKIDYPGTNRLYEMSLAYNPRGGRFSWALGRLGASPFVSIGYLDGALGQLRLTRRFYFGLFGGSRPAVEELNLASAGTKYGGFFRYSTSPDDGPGYGEVVLAGIDERAKGNIVSREYLSLESHFGYGALWTLFERVELDLNRGWRRQVVGTSSQVTNAALSASVRMSSTWRASLSYDQNRNYLTYETRPLPEEVFTNFLRQGGRVSLEYQGRSGWNASWSVGQERDDSGAKPTDSAAVSLYRANLFGWALLAGGDYSYYRGDIASGYVASLRLRKSFLTGDDIGLTFGASEAKLGLFATAPRKNRWARLSGTLQLPFRLYLTGEFEYDTGDDQHGRRYYLEAGYRF